MTAVALLVIVGNSYVAVQPGRWASSQWNPLPHSRALRDMFLLPGMFSTYSRKNVDPFIGGKRTDTGDERDRGQWVRLEVSEHFPHRNGVNFTRIYAMHHRDMWGAEGQRRAWAQTAERIRHNHNRLHPDRPIERVRFGLLWWPKSPAGYRVRKTAKEIETQTLFAESESTP